MKGAKSPLRVQSTRFSNFFKVRKSASAGRKDFFDTLRPLPRIARQGLAVMPETNRNRMHPSLPLSCPHDKGRWHLRQQMTEGICCKVQSAPKFAAFEFPQALWASVPTLFGPSGHFPLIGGIGPLRPRGAFAWGVDDGQYASCIFCRTASFFGMDGMAPEISVERLAAAAA